MVPSNLLYGLDSTGDVGRREGFTGYGTHGQTVAQTDPMNLDRW